MLRLMKIDLKKYNLKRQPLYFLMAYFLMAGMAFSILYMDNGALVESAPVVIDVLLKPVFIVWEAFLISSIIIDEFKSKTILLLYTYPLDKQKLMLSKVILVLLFSAGGILAGQIILNGLFFGIHQFIPAVPYTLTIGQAIGYFVSTIMVILLGLIPMCVGLVRYSTVATMITSIIIITAGSSSGLGFDQFLRQIGFVSVLGVVGTATTVYSLVSLGRRDIVI